MLHLTNFKLLMLHRIGLPQIGDTTIVELKLSIQSVDYVVLLLNMNIRWHNLLQFLASNRATLVTCQLSSTIVRIGHLE